MAKLLATLREIDKESISIQDTLKIFAGLSEPEVLNNLDKLAETISKVDQEQLAKLEHPGQVLYLRKVDSKNLKIFSVNLLIFFLVIYNLFSKL